MMQNVTINPLSDEELQKEYQGLLDKLSINQLRFVIARLECKSDREAAKMIHIAEQTVYRWEEKEIIDRAVHLAHMDGVILALTMQRKALPRAMAVKIKGLESGDEKIQQGSATEIREWELGKAVQRQEVTGANGGAIQIEAYLSALDRVYGSDPDPKE